MKKIVFLLILTLSAGVASAYRIQWGRTIIISQPVYEDLYIAGGTITLNAPVYGDVIVVGGTIFINDTITNDLLLAGGNVQFNGYVADDIRCAGGELFVKNNVGGDLVITGGTVEIGPEVTIGGGLIASGGELRASGLVKGDVRAASGKFVFNGTANKRFDVRSQTLELNGTILGPAVLAARELRLGNSSSFHNDVRYWTKKQHPDFSTHLRGGKANFDPSLKIASNSWYYLGQSTILGLFWYLSTVLLFMIILQYLFRNLFDRAGDTVGHSDLKSLGLGFLFFVGVPVGVVLMLITVIGLPLGLLVMVGYIVLLLLATIITSLVLANWYNHRFNCQWGFWRIVFGALAMFILFKLITFTPLFGWFIMLILASVAFGTLLRNIHWPRKPEVSMH